MEKLILTGVILLCFLPIMSDDFTKRRPIWWYFCLTVLIVACLWDVARTGTDVKLTKTGVDVTAIRIDSTCRILNSTFTSADPLTNMVLQQQKHTIDSLRNELALRDTADYISEHSKIEP